MSEFLDTLRSRMTEAQARLGQAKQKLDIAQQEYQAAILEAGSWKNAVDAETRRIHPTSPNSRPAASDEFTTSEEATALVTESRTGEGNKTDTVRCAIGQHPTGITASDLWRELQGRINHRPYLYSILKRLRDKGEAVERRGKYFLKSVPKVQEDTQQQSLLQ